MQQKLNRDEFRAIKQKKLHETIERLQFIMDSEDTDAPISNPNGENRGNNNEKENSESDLDKGKAVEKKSNNKQRDRKEKTGNQKQGADSGSKRQTKRTFSSGEQSVFKMLESDPEIYAEEKKGKKEKPRSKGGDKRNTSGEDSSRDLSEDIIDAPDDASLVDKEGIDGGQHDSKKADHDEEPFKDVVHRTITQIEKEEPEPELSSKEKEEPAGEIDDPPEWLKEYIDEQKRELAEEYGEDLPQESGKDHPLKANDETVESVEQDRIPSEKRKNKDNNDGKTPKIPRIKEKGNTARQSRKHLTMVVEEDSNGKKIRSYIKGESSEEKQAAPESMLETEKSVVKETESEPRQNAFPTQAGASLVRKSNGGIVPIAKVQFSIGTEDDNEYVFNERYISRHHAMIIRIAGKYLIMDTGSTNGTFVNGKRINKGEQVPLKGNDIITLANQEFIFVEEL